ncbi:acyl carrier protein [Streptomyces sp. NPDC006193]|uniref:acyl carrier protein n=1 Tax=Streptomyces sp. NPDC006193 TaxID=3155717 RepID=UPI00339E8B50
MFSIDDLRRIMRQCAGENDPALLDGDILDVPFQDLGYDSLALLESTSVIEREFDVQLPDDVVSQVRTPAELIAVVGERVARTR